MIDLALSLTPAPYVSCHTHFDHQTGGVTIDPRDQWDYINSRVPFLFKSAWIKTRQSVEEMGWLFGHANSIGLGKLFLYTYDMDGTTYIGRVEIAADRGWNEGWLKRLQKQREDKWCCPTQTFDVSECDLESWQYTGLEQWV